MNDSNGSDTMNTASASSPVRTQTAFSVAANRNDGCVVVIPSGRLDAFGARQFQACLDEHVVEDVRCVVVDMADVHYLSSAAIRALVVYFKQCQQRGGALALAALQPYCREVLDVAGMLDRFMVFDSATAAVGACRALIREHVMNTHWDELEAHKTPCGTFKFIPGSPDACAIHVLGHVNEVLDASVNAQAISSKRFSETEYSIGLGGLGNEVDDYYGIMGEMITIGGTMVWLPTDGHDTPDFLIPKTDRGQVTIRTAYNVAIAGHFNEYVYFESDEPGGARVDDIYQALFSLSRQRREDYHGVLGLAFRAQMNAVYGSGITHSPVRELAPKDGGRIIDPANVKDWFEFDSAPRHERVTALLCGVGADMNGDLSFYDEKYLGAVFYLNPGNKDKPRALLHNHGVFFSELPMPSRAANLEKEIQHVLDDGDFVDMRHLLDSSTITSAIIGISYIQRFIKDPAGH
ncbi:MAG: anti-sigma factor antagonist [Spartobacteria bacterium]|nr:anti-sigma factor antagonist [Spartobacteria bacterium]